MELDQIRALAGMPALLSEAKKKKDDAAIDTSVTDDTAAPPAGGGEKTEEEKLQEMLEGMAKKAEGKDAKALVGVFRKVYDAGVKDGIAQCEADKS